VSDWQTVYREWQVPPFEANNDKKLAWLSESMQEGQAWLKSQRGYEDMRKALDVLSGRMTDVIPEYKSQLNSNRLKRNIREVVGALSDIRPLWGYHTDNDAFLKQAEMMNKVSRAIYLNNFFDRDIRKALQYAAATCTGWLRPIYKRDAAGSGRGDIRLMAYGSPSILPCQMPQDNDIQEAYAVTIVDEVPIFKAHAMWPEFQHKIKPGNSKFWYVKDTKVPQATNAFRKIFGRMNGRGAGQNELLCEIRYTYVIDLSVNYTDKVIPMGEVGSSWYYEVPYLGMDIPVGKDPDGTIVYKKADVNQARIYPRRRLMIHSEGVLLYDGPSFDWHGKVPLVPFCVDDWPWEGIGFSLVRDGYNQQSAINELQRGMMDINRARLNLPLAFDINAVSKREAQRFDPMEPASRVGFDGSVVDKPFQLPIPHEVMDIPAQVPNFIKEQQDTMDYQMGLKDIMALAKARAGGASDDVEKVLEASGPIVKDISRTMERSMRDLGDMIKYLILQYYDAPRVMRLVGPDGITPETFDYNPDSLIPSHVPGENPDNGPSIYSNMERARKFADNINFFITPNSLHSITQMSRKLLYLQLARTPNFPMDARTVAEALDIPNFGNSPAGNTVVERWKNQKEEELEFAARMAQLKESLPGLQAPAGMDGGKNIEGRKPSAGAPPAIKSKGDGRPVVTESK
jgi:hypothetical protein